MEPHIYFIKCNEFVKIGVSHSPDSRLDDLQIGNPYELKIIGYIANGGFKLEKEIQKRFFNQLIHHEWFRLNNEIKEYINTTTKKWKFRVYKTE